MFRRRCILTCLLVILLSTFATCEIHRTRTSKGAKAYPGSGLHGGADDREVETSVSGRRDETSEGPDSYPLGKSYSRNEAWIYAILATVLVGLTGIFPLVLPIDVNPSSNDERGKLKNCYFIIIVVT